MAGPSISVKASTAIVTWSEMLNSEKPIEVLTRYVEGEDDPQRIFGPYEVARSRLCVSAWDEVPWVTRMHYLAVIKVISPNREQYKTNRKDITMVELVKIAYFRLEETNDAVIKMAWPDKMAHIPAHYDALSEAAARSENKI
jgi:hypothetical protein